MDQLNRHTGEVAASRRSKPRSVAGFRRKRC